MEPGREDTVQNARGQSKSQHNHHRKVSYPDTIQIYKQVAELSFMDQSFMKCHVPEATEIRKHKWFASMYNG